MLHYTSEDMVNIFVTDGRTNKFECLPTFTKAQEIINDGTDRPKNQIWNMVSSEHIES